MSLFLVTWIEYNSRGNMQGFELLTKQEVVGPTWRIKKILV